MPLDPRAEAFIERASSRPARPPGSVPLKDLRAAERAMSTLDDDLRESLRRATLGIDPPDAGDRPRFTCRSRRATA